MISVLIIDDHVLFREGIKLILELEFHNIEIKQADEQGEALKLIRSQKWDLILLDITMPGKNGLDLLKQIRAEGYQYPLLILTMHREELFAIRTLSAGAQGYMNKEIKGKEFIEAVRKILSGKKYINSRVSELLSENIGKTSKNVGINQISDREFQVLSLIASGKSLKEIAATLCLGIPTVSTYRSRILEKLQLKNNAELTHFAIQEGIA